jgi:hypothetical protein
MPGPYIHMSSAKHAAALLARRRYEPPGSERINPGWTGRDLQQLAALMQGKPNYTATGAIGPDLFFFLPDFRDEHGVITSSVLIRILEFLDDLYSKLDPYISKYEHYLGPISEDTAEEMSRLTGGLSEIVGDISGELSGILITALEDFVTQQRDWWEFFSLGLNKGYDDQAYFWSDMLHYRDTGIFGRALWQAADTVQDDGARAYALGYLTHIATDVTGHAFVNSISGGPFRQHWQRHHLVENHMDAYWYLRDPLRPGFNGQYPQWTESALYFDIAFKADGGVVARPPYPTGETLREKWVRRRVLDIDSDLPDSVATALLDAMVQTFYQGRPHPKILRDNDGRPSPKLIKEAYKLFFRFLKLTSVDGFGHEPPPPPDVFPNLNFPTLSDPSSSPPGSADGGSFWDDLLNFILAVIAVILYIVEVAAYLATLPWAILADIVTYPLRLGLYYALELPLYHLLKNFRAVMVMTGYMAPMADEIASGLVHVGMPDATTFQSVLDGMFDAFGGLDTPPPPIGEQPYRDQNYPHYHPQDEFRHPWQYPDTHTEWMYPGPDEHATAGPHPAGVGVEALFGALGADAAIRDALEAAETPQAADAIDQQLMPNRHLGDVVGFSEYLIWLESRDTVQKDGTQVPLVEWNLDSDRGYGYHCWDWNRDAAAAPVQDPEGNPYQPPCTWPSQADSGWNEATPLQAHWFGPGLADPGCLGGPPIGFAAAAPTAGRRLRSRRPRTAPR